MNVFESIGLTADPFSTSPSIEMFYNATRHKQCLEGLELAIRMKRGLSVVRGGIGVGKTTLSRKLIQNFKSETDVFEFHLMLDPKFESELELLKHIIELFGIDNPVGSVQDNRNIIENHLLQVGVDDGKILTLIVDEGQNMPENMLDIFRTLLNFEANDYKLLQLIIFGQPEMGTMIKKYPNFEDRISFDFELGPLSLQDTTGFIHSRMKHVSGVDREWFTQQVIENIYKKTGGYPRKITQVCHELLLSLLNTKNRTIDGNTYDQVFSNNLPLINEGDPDKKDYSTIAVNKLLDVLRKDSGTADTEELTEGQDAQEEWIGGEPVDENINPKNDTEVIETQPTSPKLSEASDPADPDKIEDNEIIKNISTIQEKPVSELIEKEVVEASRPSKVSEYLDSDLIGLDEDKGSDGDKEINIIAEKDSANEPVSGAPVHSDLFENSKPETMASNLMDNQLENPGVFMDGKKKLLSFEQKYIHGFSIDNGKLRSIILTNKGGKKKLLSAHRINTSNSNNKPLDEPNEFGLILTQFIDDLSLKLTDATDINNKVRSILKNRSALSISISGISSYSRVIKIAKDNASKPQEIVEWAMKTNQPFESSSIKISDISKQSNGTLIAAAADEKQLENYGDLFRGLDWIITRWIPESISLFNAFKWNFPDYSTHASIIFHLGESHSFIIACKGNCLLQIEPVHIGIKNLYETIKDQKTAIKDWFDRSNYQIPSVLLSEFGIQKDAGLFDNEFRPIIDSWRQSFNRCLTSIKKNHPIDENTKLLLSGSFSEISHSTKYFELAFGFPCELLNPFRNLNLPSDTSFLSADAHPSLFTIAIGNALSSINRVTLLPTYYQENEKFRIINKTIIPAAAIFIVFLLSFSGYKYSYY
ncbi:MAG: AAA family ATPase, partial [Pseudomonadota bacterium]|nr:AAA family ATPase [Pseudomonadota bacterium]